MVLQKQNNQPRYTKSSNIFIIWFLVLVFVIWFGILIQKSENDLRVLSSQMRLEADQIRQKTNVRVQRSTYTKENIAVSTWSLSTWLLLTWTTSTWNK